MLLKKPERTTSRPVASVVQEASRSGETMPSRERELEDVPALFAEDGDRRALGGQRVALAGDGLDERGLAAAVGAEDADVFARADF